MNRRQARETVFSLVFAHDFQQAECDEAEYETALASMEAEDDPYVRSCFFGILEKHGEIDELISRHAVGWKTNRMTRTSLAIMRVATYEMLNAEDVPAAVAINEALEIAKIYDDDNAPAFINGILNAIARAEGKIQ